MAIVTAFLDYEPIDVLVSNFLDPPLLSIEVAEKPADVATANVNRIGRQSLFPTQVICILVDHPLIRNWSCFWNTQPTQPSQPLLTNVNEPPPRCWAILPGAISRISKYPLISSGHNVSDADFVSSLQIHFLDDRQHEIIYPPKCGSYRPSRRMVSKKFKTLICQWAIPVTFQSSGLLEQLIEHNRTSCFEVSLVRL
jgi:hypothetical protein